MKMGEGGGGPGAINKDQDGEEQDNGGNDQ
jgi:hypothetical protein